MARELAQLFGISGRLPSHERPERLASLPLEGHDGIHGQRKELRLHAPQLSARNPKIGAKRLRAHTLFI